MCQGHTPVTTTITPAQTPTTAGGHRRTRTHLPAAAIAHDGDDVARDALPAATELDAAAHPRVQLCALAVPPPLQESAQLRLQHAGSHILGFQAPPPGN